jgi:ribonucleoside-diphosphate reductase alpha chain
MYAWKSGVKTTYYLRSRPATKIAKVTTRTTSTSSATASAAAAEEVVAKPQKTYTDAEALACSLENPEVCEACQ